MIRLKNRNQFPSDLVFRQPETNFTTRPHSSFRGMCEAVVNHRKANPELARIHQWQTEIDLVAAEVDSYLAIQCQAMGPSWSHFIVEGNPDPPRPAPSSPLTRLRRGLASVAGASETIISWIKSKEEAVPREQANERAKVCVSCKFNEAGDWTTIFTRPAAEAIAQALRQARDWKLSTDYDSQLKTCTACQCPLVIKQHMPLAAIREKMKPEVFNAMPEWCWMKKESTK